MDKITDQAYLVSEQYQDEANLDARIRLHRRFSVNRCGWFRWVFDQLRFNPTDRILELGCGPASLWQENLPRVPAGWRVTLSDLSARMVAQTQRNLGDGGGRFAYQVIDAQELPFPDASFDGIVANHMLYHVPDMAQALAEIRRVLRGGGRFYATTVGCLHLQELYELVSRFAGSSALWAGAAPEAFTLENGTDLLERWFSEVVLRRYEDKLVITEGGPLVSYVQSMMVAESVLGENKVAAFAEFVNQELAQRGAILVTKDSGLFAAVRTMCVE